MQPAFTNRKIKKTLKASSWFLLTLRQTLLFTLQSVLYARRYFTRRCALGNMMAKYWQQVEELLCFAVFDRTTWKSRIKKNMCTCLTRAGLRMRSTKWVSSVIVWCVRSQRAHSVDGPWNSCHVNCCGHGRCELVFILVNQNTIDIRTLYWQRVKANKQQ